MLPRLFSALSRGLFDPLNAIERIASFTAHNTLSTVWKLNRRFAAYAHRINYEMDKVYLRNIADSKELHINFRYANEELRVDRDFNFCRKMDEKVDDALTRIRNNIEKELNKRTKKGKKKTPAQVQEPLPISSNEISVEILRASCDDKVTDITFAELLGSASDDLRLRVLDRTFEIVLNQPWVVNMVLPSSILAGFTVYPGKVELQFAERKNCLGAWYKAKMPSSGDLRVASWEHCVDGFFYNTTNEDIGYYLKFVLTPGNATGRMGPPVEHVTKNAVQAGPGPCPFEIRHCFTKERLSGDELRVVSYNILADLYADSDYTRTHLFPYCPPYALKIEYRKQLYMKEITGYNADIVCLQEVDMRVFDSDLRPVLEAPEHGFRGVIAQKGTCGEGVAIFYRDARFEVCAKHELNIGEGIPTLPEFAELWQKICKNEKLAERICDRSTTLQLLLLKNKENGRYLLVANTHLYFHPDADHIRLLQIGFSMLYVEHIYKCTLAELKLDNEQQLALIFCGDFNSVPECGIYKLMTEGFVGEDSVDWSSNKEEAVTKVSLAQSFNLKSACGTPTYTNYTHAFAACLDYIFYQNDRLEVQQVVPLPTDEELQAHVAIPSVVFPSDHVALIADLKFKSI